MNRSVRARGLLAFPVLAIFALACNSTSGDDPTGNDGRIDVSMTPGALTIRAGTTGFATINIVRTNYTEAVSFILVNPLAGISTAFTPSTANTTELAVTVGASVPPGQRALAIRTIVFGNIPFSTLHLPLTVVAAPTAGQIEYLYCDPAQAPVFFAYQDGTNDWQAVTASTSGGAVRFRINLTSNRGGVMAVFRSSVDAALSQRRASPILSGKHLSPGMARRLRHSTARRPRLNHSSQIIDVYGTAVLYGTASELADDGAQTCAATLRTKTVTGTVTGVSAGQYGIVTLPNATEIFEGGVSPNPVTFSGVPGGWIDLVASRLPQAGLPPNRGVILRNLDVGDGRSLESPIDFNGPSSFDPATATVNVTGAGGDNLEVFTGLVTATGGDQGFWFELSSGTSSSRPWAGLNAANMRPGEFHSLAVFASPPGSTGDFRVAVKYPGPVANETIAIGSTVDLPSVSEIAAGAYPRYRFQGSLPAEYNRGVTIAVDPEDVGNAFFALATTTYLAAAGTAQAYDLAMPNVSTLPGFPVAARLGPGLNVVTVDAFGFTGPGSFDVRPAPGREFKASDRVSTLIVP